jgi:hypothetical protein
MVKHVSGMILTCSSIVPIKSLKCVYLSMTNPMSSPFVMIMLVETTLVLKRLLQGFYNVDFIGLLCSVSLTLTVPLMSAAKS